MSLYPLPLRKREPRSEGLQTSLSLRLRGRGAWRLWGLLLLLFLLSACAPAPQASAPTAAPAAFARPIATVELPPTPDDAQRRATQIAAHPSPTFRAPTLAVSPTVYIGVFLGVEADEGALPVVDPALFAGTLGAPTAITDACPLPADPAFGTGWASLPGVAERLGCPTGSAVTAQGSMQVFERGMMVFVPSGEIRAMQTAGASGGPYWRVAQAPADRPWEQAAPAGLRIPSLGFGATWKANADLREAIGFALSDETGSSITLQPFEGGGLLRESISGGVFALVGSPDSGIAYGPLN